MKDGDIISIDAEAGTLDVSLSEEELADRKKDWQAKDHEFQSGELWKYSQLVGSARGGAVTHPGAKAEVKCYADS